MTGASDHREGGVTGHLHAANRTMTGRASQFVSTYVDSACMHAAQAGPPCGDFDSEDSDVDSTYVDDALEEEGAVDALDAALDGEVVHNGVHFYVDVLNSEDSA